MVDKQIIKIVQNYLKIVDQNGIPVRFGVLYGSYAKGIAHEDSDIDLLVVSPYYDQLSNRTHKKWGELWYLTTKADFRIEPVPVGEKQYEENDSMLIDIAHREGQIIPLAE